LVVQGEVKIDLAGWLAPALFDIALQVAHHDIVRGHLKIVQAARCDGDPTGSAVDGAEIAARSGGQPICCHLSPVVDQGLFDVSMPIHQSRPPLFWLTM
jgi:hypothetical protein